jgi:hypothetical protein
MMTEIEAKQIIEDNVKDIVLGETISIVLREPASRYEHKAIFAITFKYDDEKIQTVMNAIKKLSFSDPNFEFGGTDVDDKFKMEYGAVLVSASIKG